MTPGLDNANPIVQYWEAIQSGREVVSRKVYKTMAQLIRQLQQPGDYVYSPSRAQHTGRFTLCPARAMLRPFNIGHWPMSRAPAISPRVSTSSAH